MILQRPSGYINGNVWWGGGGLMGKTEKKLGLLFFGRLILIMTRFDKMFLKNVND